jgi:hypothetical protein
MSYILTTNAPRLPDKWDKTLFYITPKSSARARVTKKAVEAVLTGEITTHTHPGGEVGSGDMVAATYDPGSVEGDAFDMDNMVEGTDTKILTASERSLIASALQSETSHDDVLVDDDIGVTVAAQGHDHDGTYAPVLEADDNYVTDAEKVVIGNTSGTNTGDQSSGDFDHDSLQNTHNLTTDIDHMAISNVGTNTHAQIDTHIGSTSNPHSVDKDDVGLSNVPNTDATARANHTGTQTLSTISDAGTGAAVNIHVGTSAPGSPSTGDLWVDTN